MIGFGHIHRVLLNSYEFGGEDPSNLQESLKRYAKRYGFQLYYVHLSLPDNSRNVTGVRLD